MGNFVVAAHRITRGEPLRDMPSLRRGDAILVETRDAVYTYELDSDPNDLVVDLTADWVLKPRPVNPDPGGVQPGPGLRLITLITCAELFRTDDRMVVFGHLAMTRPK